MQREGKSICWIRVFKNIAYFIIPIIITAIFTSIISVIYVQREGMSKDGNNYFETNDFAQNYLDGLNHIVYSIHSVLPSEGRENMDLYEQQGIQLNGENINVFYGNVKRNFLYLIIDKENNVAYTNVDYNVSHLTIDSVKDEILKNNLRWTYEEGKVDTTIEKLKDENIKNTNLYKNNLNKNNYVIYTAIMDELPYYDAYFEGNMIYNITKNQYDYAIYNIPISIIVLILLVPIIFIGIGKTNKNNGIYLTWFDKLPIEVSTIIIGVISFCGCGLAFVVGNSVVTVIGVIIIWLGFAWLYASGVLLLETTVKRFKTHTFIKTTFAYWIYCKMRLAFSNMKLSLKVGGVFAGFVIANWILFEISRNDAFVAFVLLMTLYALSFIYVLKRVVWLQKINTAIEEIYKGNTNIRLNEEEFKGDFKNVAIQVNDIAGGFSNAVDEKLKSERLKTELITNVSHDIKTPLTSIINYVDLLKKEDVTNEKAQEYLTILDNKSQRLKKLTEDLVEASKASSGNIKLNMEKIEINELIKQVSAEFDDKFKSRGLEEIVTYAQEQVHINADSRYMYRVLENMYSNVAKYAMENSRVYTDIIEHGGNVIIQIKNISKDRLNITADELMQRFVRGDVSRNTEGSGLGLSIANSLTELQGGKFHIYLDGDLFKITIGFKKIA